MHTSCNSYIWQSALHPWVPASSHAFCGLLSSPLASSSEFALYSTPSKSKITKILPSNYLVKFFIKKFALLKVQNAMKIFLLNES